MEDLGRLNLRRISQIGEFNQTHVRDAACSFLPELRVIAQSRAYRGGAISLPKAVVSLSPITSRTGTLSSPNGDLNG
jgi:hypothetical protein